MKDIHWLILLIIFALLILLILFFTHYCEVDRSFKVNSYDLKKLDGYYQIKPRVESRYRVIITFTTIPDRIEQIKPTINSILSQSQKVDQIRINIPLKSSKGKEYIIPEWLKNCENIEIVRVPEDLGPSTKLLPTVLEEDPNTRVIVIDDDVIYGEDTIKVLVDCFEEKDGHEAITIFGTRVGEKLSMATLRYAQGNRYVDIMHGHGGYIVTPKMIPNKVFDYKGRESSGDLPPKEAFYVDDNWVSGWLRANQVKIWMIGMKIRAVPLPNLSACRIGALHRNFNGDGKNEKIVDDWFTNRK